MRAAIFDFDGVIVDSEPLHFQALRSSLLPEGVQIDEEEYYTGYLAYNDRTAIRLALEAHGVSPPPARVDAIARRKAGFFSELASKIPLFPGAAELVRSLAAGFPLAIASGALHGEIDAILRAVGLRDAFAAIVGADDVSRGKPDPEPYLAAMGLLAARTPGLAPPQCLVLEDSMAGIASARTAGMTVVAVTHSYPREKLGAAHHVVDSLVGLENDGLRELFGP
ncbi:MAG TPA: HAD family phosphatase [Vicinamibacteria bacterium]|nr:HAD family phosphatase [Vicinamibacteria bacterium]